MLSNDFICEQTNFRDTDIDKALAILCGTYNYFRPFVTVTLILHSVGCKLHTGFVLNVLFAA